MDAKGNSIDVIADYADAVGHSVPQIECFMESR